MLWIYLTLYVTLHLLFNWTSNVWGVKQDNEVRTTSTRVVWRLSWRSIDTHYFTGCTRDYFGRQRTMWIEIWNGTLECCMALFVDLSYNVIHYWISLNIFVEVVKMSISFLFFLNACTDIMLYFAFFAFFAYLVFYVVLFSIYVKLDQYFH